jgi:hypothetical protein
MSEDLLALVRKTGALLDGQFILRSGLRPGVTSRIYDFA